MIIELITSAEFLLGLCTGVMIMVVAVLIGLR